MADDNIISQEVTPTDAAVADQPVDAKAELASLMAVQFGKTPAPVEQNVPLESGDPSGIKPVVSEVVVPEFKFDTFKDKFGYSSPDEVLADIEALRTKVAEAPKPAEIKFENEASERLYKAIASGKQKEVTTILAEQDRLEELTSQEVTAANASEIIKMGMQLKYKGLTPDQINYKFNKQFAIPKEPVFNEDNEDETEFKSRHSDWKATVADIEMDKLIEANLIKPELESRKQALILPTIAQDVDQDYLAWKQEQESMQTTNAEVLEAYKVFKSDDVRYDQDFIDEANKISTKFQYTPSAEAFKKAQEMVTDMDKFYSMYRNSDGSPNRKAFITDIAILVDKKQFVTQAMNQAKNATLKRELPDNGAGGVVRQLVETPGEPSELDKLMAQNGLRKRQ